MTTVPQAHDAPALAAAIAQRCNQARLHGQRWQARCPAHDDRTPSLSIAPSADKVLLRCFAGCAAEAIVAALGLTLGDLFVEKPSTNGHKRVVKVYDYYDAAGTLVHQTVRYEPKAFKQRRPDPAHPGEYLWSTKDIERVLYNLPAVLAARNAGELIHLVEGEKDAETLIALGLVATTVPMGARYWRASYTTTLTGAHVVVWPDNDDAGQAGRTKVQRHLTGKAQTLRIVHVPTPHKDVSDWVQAGGTRADLEALVQAAPPAPPVPAAPALTPTGTDPPLPYSDFTNAVSFVRDHGHTLRYCYPWNAWLVWTGTHWQRDTSGQVMRMAKQTIKNLAHQVAHLDEKGAQALLAHIKASLSTAKLKALIENAQSEPGIPVQPEDLDTHVWLLNVANGTLDLRTGQLRAHDRADLLTFALTVAYDGAATCPTWDAFLARIMAENQALITFLQRAIGYALTGVIREHVLLILWGRGRNGKSTFLNLLRRLLGAYAMKAPSELLMVSTNDRHPTERADLWGKRFVSAIETEQGRRLAEVFVKEATGGDPIRARRMREDFWEFQPTHKVLLATNHKPVITGTDTAIWERIKLVPFTVTIPEDERDTTLPEKLEHELPGILTWAVQGCRTWQDQGLGTPDEVRQATAGYQSEMDVLGQFIDDCCVTGQHYRTKASSLYDAYKHWCDQQGVVYAIQRTWGMSLTERGFERFTNNGIWYRGIGLREPIPPATEPTEPTEPKNGINSSLNSSRGQTRKSGSVPSVPSVPPSYCPGCGRESTWLLRQGREVCYKCGTQRPSERRR